MNIGNQSLNMSCLVPLVQCKRRETPVLTLVSKSQNGEMKPRSILAASLTC
jgi:hypothetical protein